MHLVLCLGGLPLLPLDLGLARGVGVPLCCRLGRAGSLPLLLRERAKWELPARCRLPFSAPLMSLTLPNSHRTFHDVGIRESLRHLAPAFYPPVVPDLRIEDQGRIRGLGHERVARVDVAVVVALAPLPVRGQEVESVDAGHRPRARSCHERSRSSDRYRSRRGSSRSRRDRSRSVDRYRSRRQRTRGGRRDRSWSPALPNHSRDRSRSSGRLPGSPACLRAEETGRLARRETQEDVGVVASQLPVVSEAAAAVTPVAGGAALTSLPSAVQDLARFFLGLSGSSSLGAIGGIARVTASLACPSTAAAGAATTCATAVTPGGAGVSPAAPAAVPGVSGEQQRKVESHSRGRRSRSSSDGTDRQAKKRARRRSPSPGRSSCHWGRRYRSTSDSSEEDRADVFPPRSRHPHGGAPAGDGSSRAYDRSPRLGTSRSYARDDRYRSGAGRRSPAPSGAADDDRSSTFESVDFARDDSFRAVLGLIRDFHDMEEPVGVPSARCKTSLASAYGLMSEVSPAFTLPASPLLRTLLAYINLALSKFLEDQTVHGFLPVHAVIVVTTAPPLPLFLGRIPSLQVLPR